jgi:hypothetical protein
MKSLARPNRIDGNTICGALHRDYPLAAAGVFPGFVIGI